MTEPRSWTRRAALAYLGTCLFASAGAGQLSPGSEAPSPEELRARIDSIRTSVEAPSAQVAVLTPDTTILWNFGVVDPESGRPVADATMFRVGSVSKSFAGITMLTLVERGLVDLDDELRGLAPELPVRNPWRVDRPVRLSHLLEAGAGFVGFQDAGYGPADPPRIPIRRVIGELPYRLDVQCPPGKHTAYHNIGPTITAYLVEKLTGERYEDVVRKRVFRPLRMAHATFFRTETVAERLARPHRPERDAERRGASDAGKGDEGDGASRYRHIRVRPSGALNSSASEMAAFVRMLLDRGRVGEGNLLRTETVERFETPTSTVVARKLDLGRGHAVNNWSSTYHGVVYHGHGGRIDRYSAYYAYAPERGTGFVYMGTRGAEGEELHYPVSAAILGYLHPDAEPPRHRETAAGERRALAGCYELVNPRSLDQPLRHLRVRAEGGRLLLLDVPSIRDAPAYTTELERLEDAPVFRLREPRRERGAATPWADELAFATDDRGVRIAEFVSFPHDAYERVACDRAAGSIE